MPRFDLERQPLVLFRLTPFVFPDAVGNLLQHAGTVIQFLVGKFFVSVENPQAALQLFQRELVGGLFGFHTPDEIRNRQPDLDFLFAAAGEVEIEAGLALGRDCFLALALVVELGITAVRDQRLRAARQDDAFLDVFLCTGSSYSIPLREVEVVSSCKFDVKSRIDAPTSCGCGHQAQP